MTEFWENTRRAPDGLFVWYNGVESGTDNSPAVVDAPAMTTEGVDLQVYLYREYLALGLIGEKLGDAEAAALYRKKAADLRALTLKLMWSDKDGLFYNLDARTGSPSRSRRGRASRRCGPAWPRRSRPSA
jgi:hypothetical protein